MVSRAFIEERDQWNKLLKGTRHSYYHTWEHCYAMYLTTNYPTFLYCYEKENVKIICPVSERIFGDYVDIVTPYGFSGFSGDIDCTEFPDHWQEYAKNHDYVCGYISLNPIFSKKSYYNQRDASIRTDLYFLDLTQSLTQLYDNLDSNRKRQIKDYRSAESKFVYDKDILTEFFIDNYYSFLDRINASEANYFSETTLRFICSLENVFMVGARDSGKITAVYIFAYTQNCGECLFNVALPEGRHHSPTLLWCGLKFFRSKKIPMMNLGGGSNIDDSIALSKQRFGAVAYPFVNLRQIYDQKVYDLLSKKFPGKEGYFPSYRSSGR